MPYNNCESIVVKDFVHEILEISKEEIESDFAKKFNDYEAVARDLINTIIMDPPQKLEKLVYLVKRWENEHLPLSKGKTNKEICLMYSSSCNFSFFSSSPKLKFSIFARVNHVLEFIAPNAVVQRREATNPLSGA